MDDVVVRLALQNAVLHGGKADSKAVLGKVLSENPELRKNILQVKKIVEWVVEEISSLPLEEQKERLQKLGGIQTQKGGREGLPPLENAVKGKVVTRFAPAPTGPLNILQVLRAVFISSLYAKEYEGTFILRFDDTDPKNVEKEFYGMIREDLRSLGIEWEKEFLQSDYLNLYYKKAEFLLKEGKVYVCFCDAKDFQLLKQRKQDCPCRWNRPDKNVLGWNGMLEGRYGEGKAVVRLITSMQDPNPALRDPPLLRIVETPHPLKEGRVWPLYNFANVVMDEFCKVTHVFRGKEHEHNTSIQKWIYRVLGGTPPEVVNFGMIYLPGEKLHTRDIKKGIQEGKYSGWDDLRLPTVRAFMRRGFVPESFRAFSIICGLSKTDIRIDVGNLEAINRKIVDPTANRYMVVTGPEEIDISGILEMSGLEGKVKIKNHPEREETREVAVTEKLFVSGEDFKRFEGRDVRLIDLFNVTLGKKPALSENQEFDMKTPKIQWVSEKNVAVRILMPEKEITGLGEDALKKIKKGKIIQMLRIGFGRVERPGVIVFGHK